MWRHIDLEHWKAPEGYFSRNFFNSISGLKSANMIGTIDDKGVSNLALFSSVVHIGAHPPLLGMIMRPLTVERQTYDYIKKVGRYTINHVHASIAAKAHWTSAKFDKGLSEFAACGLTEEFLDGFPVPYVHESQLKMGLRLVEELPIQSNGTILLVGEVEHVYVKEKTVQDDGHIDFASIDELAIGGLAGYFTVRKLAEFSFARPNQPPKNLLDQ
jgi:flavin reductase (DIM6/NTAB) family NADH-FMN oxidoreductase RutF